VIRAVINAYDLRTCAAAFARPGAGVVPELGLLGDNVGDGGMRTYAAGGRSRVDEVSATDHEAAPVGPRARTTRAIGTRGG
jgi:hypothetical protein